MHSRADILGFFSVYLTDTQRKDRKRIFDFSDVNYDQFLFRRSTVDAEFMTVAESRQINMYVHYEHVFIKKKQHITSSMTSNYEKDEFPRVTAPARR